MKEGMQHCEVVNTEVRKSLLLKLIIRKETTKIKNQSWDNKCKLQMKKYDKNWNCKEKEREIKITFY